MGKKEQRQKLNLFVQTCKSFYFLKLNCYLLYIKLQLKYIKMEIKGPTIN